MKKLILSLTVASFVMLSCKKEENKQQIPMTDPPVESATESTNTAEDTNATPSMPTFQYAEAEQFAKEYIDFAVSYRVASANKDSKALKELGPKLNEFQKRGVELAKRVPQQEAVAFQNFLSKMDQYIH